MKKVLLVVAIVALTAIAFTSCYKQCVCKDIISGEIVSSGYSGNWTKDECDRLENLIHSGRIVQCTRE